MYKSGLFDEKVMSTWEKRRDEVRKWESAKKFFFTKAEDDKTFKKSTTRNAANVEEDFNTDTEDSVSVVLEAMQANTEQINAVATTNESKQTSTLLGVNENLVKALVPFCYLRSTYGFLCT